MFRKTFAAGLVYQMISGRRAPDDDNTIPEIWGKSRTETEAEHFCLHYEPGNTVLLQKAGELVSSH